MKQEKRSRKVRESSKNSNSVKIQDTDVFLEAKGIAATKNYPSIGVYVTDAVREKNNRNK